MKIVSSAEMREIDRTAISGYGIPSLLLMGSAGKGAAEIIMKKYPSAKKIAVICGTGNNGGDGFCAAYYLKNSSRQPEVFIAGDPSKISSDSLIYKNICEKLSVPLIPAEEFPGNDAGFDLVIDAVFGTGFRGNTKGFHKKLFNSVNQYPAPVVCIDIPSGLPSEGPVDSPDCVTADLTITIGLPKLSLVTYPGKRFTGELEVLDIGFPVELTGAASLKNSLVSGDYVKKILSNIKHDPEDHKYTRGHLLIAGGFEGMEGAALLSARAALETGAGLVTILTEQKSRASIAGLIPEVMTMGIKSPESEAVSSEIAAIFDAGKFNAVLAGPGLGRGDISRAVLNAITDELRGRPDISLILDGDALFLISPAERPVFEGETGRVLLTPHSMEAVRLLGADRKEIENDRPAGAKQIALRASCSVCLKGPATVTTDGDNLFVNTTGSSNLATAGSGDVLAGIAAALSLKMTPIEAGTAAAYIHGIAGDLLMDENRSAIKAGDIIAKIQPALCGLLKLQRRQICP